METPSYEIDAKWKIVRASDEFCRTFRCTEPGLIGRDIRDLLRDDWRLDFRAYVARALVGVGDTEVTIPMVAPCGEHSWFKHALEPMVEGDTLLGYRATLSPQSVHEGSPPKRWWDWRPTKMVWNYAPATAPAPADTPL